MDSIHIYLELLVNIDRINNILDRRIGPSFDNEAVMQAFREEKVLSSLRLVMEDDQDIENPPVYTYDTNGHRRPFSHVLLSLYSKAEDQVLNNRRHTFVREYLKSCSLLEKDEMTFLVKSLQKIRRKADNLDEHYIVKAAYIYYNILTSEDFDFPYSDVFSRFYTYMYLVECDKRLAGLPLEMVFYARASEHNLICGSDFDSVALVFSDCILSSIYALTFIRDMSRKKAEIAKNYLLTLVEKGRKFKCDTIAKKLGVDEETAFELFIKPAFSSEGFTVFLDSQAREEYLILG